MRYSRVIDPLFQPGGFSGVEYQWTAARKVVNTPGTNYEQNLLQHYSSLA